MQSQKQQPHAVVEAAAALSLTKCQVLCLSQSLIWAITFCLHTLHSSFLGGISRHSSYLQSHKAPPNTLLRSRCPTERKASPLPSGVLALLPVVLSSLTDVSKEQSLFPFKQANKHCVTASQPLWELLCCLPGQQHGLAGAKVWFCLGNRHPWAISHGVQVLPVSSVHFTSLWSQGDNRCLLEA